MVHVTWGNKLAENFRWRQVNPSVRYCGAQLWRRRHRFISAPRGWGRRLPTCLWARTFLKKKKKKSRMRGVISRHLINIFISMRCCACQRAARRGGDGGGGPWLVPSRSRWEAAEKPLERQSGTWSINAGGSPCSGARCRWLNSGGCKPREKTRECLCNHWQRRVDTLLLFSPPFFTTLLPHGEAKWRFYDLGVPQGRFLRREQWKKKKKKAVSCASCSCLTV